MNNLINLFRTSLLYTVFPAACFLAACDSGNSGSNTVVQTQTSNANGSTVAFPIPDRIRNSAAVNLDAVNATVTTSAGNITLTREGDQFIGSIRVEEGSLFSYTLTLSENVDGQEVTYATNEGGLTEGQTVTNDFTITLTLGDFQFPDTDGDNFDNLTEIEAGSDHENSFSTPNDPDGMPPTETSPGQFDFSARTFTVAEADGELIIPVTRTGGTDGRVTVRYNTRNGTAINGEDFAVTQGVLVWEDGDTTPQNITIAILADDVNDGEQTFTASLFSPNGGAGIGVGFTTITLTDSTPPAQRGTIQLASNQIAVDEDAGVVIIEVERISGSDGIVGIDYDTTPGTASEDDFSVVSVDRGIVWTDGEQGTRTIRIPITVDSEVETAETFSFTLSNSFGGATLGQSTATVTITDTTPVPVLATGQLSLTQNRFTVSEGGSVDIEVERQSGSDGAASIEYTVTAGTADADDFTGTSGILEWEDGDSGNRTITISALADDELESDETVVVSLENASGSEIGISAATVTITDATVVAAAVPGIIAFPSVTAVVIEGESIEIDVSRTGGSDGEVTVDVTAAASGDYTVSPTQLVWADGDTEDKTITLTAVDDDNFNDTETVSISLENATGGATFGGSTISVTVNDTTAPPEPEQPTEFFAADGEWEVCIAPFNNSNTSAFATQLSANEGRIVSCIKTCDIGGMILDEQFPGWGWNPIDQHSCTTARDAEGTYTRVPIYTPLRETVNLNINTQSLTVDDSIWACVNETRENAEFNYEPDLTNTLWFQFLDDGTYFYDTTQDGSQPLDLIGPEIWGVDGRVLEIGHLNTGYRNTLFFPGNRTLHIHPTTDNRLNCTRETRPASAIVQ